MQDLKTPKIILNDDYVDLRENQRETISDCKKTSTYTTTSKRTASLNSEGDCNERDLINHGLRKLITTFNSAPAKMQSQSRLNAYSRSRFIKPRETIDNRFRRKLSPEKKSFTSQSESTLQTDKLKFVRNPSCSTPSISEKVAQKTSDQVSVKENQGEPVCEDKGTMTDFKLCLMPTAHRNVTPDGSNVKVPTESTSFIRNLDPRLLEKYPDLLRKPCFKRSWTVPFLGPTSSFLGMQCDKTSNRDKASTYLYDEGSDMDSTIIEMQKVPSTSALQIFARKLLICIGSICGIILVSGFIWLLFGKDMMTHVTQFLARRKHMDENILKRAIKGLTGSLLYVVNTFVLTLFRIITIPTNEVLGHSER